MEQAIKININETIRVKLTDYGKNIYYHYYDDVNKIYGKEVIKPRYPRVDKEGYSYFQLWKFMQVFGGDEMGMGKPAMIEKNSFEYREDYWNWKGYKEQGNEY